MSGSPFRIVPLEKKVGDLLRRVGVLERKAKAGGATTLDGLRDTEVLYDHWTDLPKLGQALRWDTTRESKFHGLATFADPTVVSDFFSVSITGTGSPEGLEEFMVDTDWDVTRPCLATATAVLDEGYTPQQVSPPTVPVTYIEGPTMSLLLGDGDSGRVTTASAGYEIATSERPLRTFYSNAHSVSWVFLRGRPLFVADMTITAAQAAGISLPATLNVVTRVTRI